MTKPKKPSGVPGHLTDSSKELWQGVIGRCQSPGRQALLCVALEALDRADEAGAMCDKDGLTTTTKTTGAIHLHPCLKVERENRALFAKLWHQLGLQWDADLDSFSRQ